MSEKQNCGARDFSKYDAMETQELEEILRQDAEATDEQESDIEKILYITGVLVNRERNNNTGNEAQMAWESFEKDYLLIEEEPAHTEQSRKTVGPWVRRLTAIAAVFVLLIGISATVVGAFGWERVWNAVAKWAKETFSFVSDGNQELTEPEQRIVKEYTSLREALEETGQRTDMIPTQIPEGFIVQDITVDETPMQKIYIAIYNSNSRKMKITVQSYLDADPEKIEMDNTLLEVYTLSGAEYYIFQNDVQLRAAWITDSYECYISGDLTLDEMKAMINSIGKG